MHYKRVAPEGTVTCWYLKEDEKIKALKEGNTFIPHGLPYLFFNLLRRIDSVFIEGNFGRLDDYGGGKYYNEIVRGHEYFDVFGKREPVYFTFDGATLYQWMEIFPETPLRLMYR